MLLGRYPIFQYAYFVDDIDLAAAKWHKLLGAGPFFAARHHRCDRFHYRGQPIEADVSYAFAYCGETQIQLIAQHDEQPSIYRDMFAAGEEGLHHIGALVSDFDDELGRIEDMGFETACRLYADGVDAAYLDTRSLIGYFTELHGDPVHILGTFANWKRQHDTWDGRGPLVRG